MKTKKFNEYVDEPKIGDYIIFGSENTDWDIPNTDLSRYLEKHIGKLFDIIDDRNVIIIEFDKKPKEISVYSAFYDGKTRKRYNSKIELPSTKSTDPNKFYVYINNNILHWSKNKEDLDIVIISKKYNL